MFYIRLNYESLKSRLNSSSRITKKLKGKEGLGRIAQKTVVHDLHVGDPVLDLQHYMAPLSTSRGNSYVQPGVAQTKQKEETDVNSLKKRKVRSIDNHTNSLTLSSLLPNIKE